MPFLIDNPYASAGATAGAIQALESMREQQRYTQAMQMRMGTHPDQIKQRQMFGEMWGKYRQQQGADPNELQFELDGIAAGGFEPGDLFRWENDRKNRAAKAEDDFNNSVREAEARSMLKLTEDETKRLRDDFERQRGIDDNIEIMRKARGPDGKPLLEGEYGPAIEIAIRGGAKPFEAFKNAMDMQRMKAAEARRAADATQRQANADRSYALDVQREERLNREDGGGSRKLIQREIDLHNMIFEAPPEVIAQLLEPKPGVKRTSDGVTSVPVTAEDWQKSANAISAVREFIHSPDATYGYLRTLAGKLAMAPKDIQDEAWTRIVQMEREALETAKMLGSLPEGVWQQVAPQMAQELGFASVEEMRQAAKSAKHGSPRMDGLDEWMGEAKGTVDQLLTP